MRHRVCGVTCLVSIVVMAAGLAPPAGAGAAPVVRVDGTEARGESFAGAWVDVRHQVIHHDGTTTPVSPRLKGQVAGDAVAVPGGLVMDTPRREGVSYLGFDGAQRVLATKVSHFQWAVDDAGTQLVYATYNNRGDDFLVLVDIATGAELARRKAKFADVLDFADGVVWTTMPAKKGPRWNVDAARWDLASNRITRLPKRLRWVDAVDVEAGVAHGTRGAYDEIERFVPLHAGDWRPWTTRVVDSADVSPNGRYVVTTRWTGVDTVVQVRRTTTGRVLRTFRGELGSSVVWESSRAFVIGWDGQRRTAVLRLSVDGAVERISRYGSLVPPVIPVEE